MIPWDVVEAKIIDEHLIAVTFADGLRPLIRRCAYGGTIPEEAMQSYG